MRPSQSEQEDAGEGYFASISDLMVGILFIFLLMLAVFAVNYAPVDKNKIQDLEDRVAALTLEVDMLRTQLGVMDKQLGVMDKQIATQNVTIATVTQERDKLRRVLADLAEQLKNINITLNDDMGGPERIRGQLLFDIQEKLASQKVKVDVDITQGILRLLSEGLFEVGEANFKKEGLNSAKALIEVMSGLLPCYPMAQADGVSCKKQPLFETVLIEGHSDTRQLKEGGNWRLSTERAWAFLRLTFESAPNLKDLKNDKDQSLLGLAGYGDTRPLLEDGEDERNRRIEIRFLLSSRREDLTDKIRRLDTSLATLRALVDNGP